ncbi:MAG TPA: M6 family metalloprotease domain-containing protein [Candidatus Wallbacteria bacterium]|nr:M6 family metalloprotease domain-containing protein [Candidatus Wallbacteria bacterium]
MGDFKDYFNKLIIFSSIFFLITFYFCQSQTVKYALSKSSRTSQLKKAPPYPGKIMSKADIKAHSASFISRAPAPGNKSLALASKGSLKVIAVRCQFPEESSTRINGNGRMKESLASITSNMSEFSNYFKTVSFNNLNITVDVSPEIYEAPQKMTYYGGGSESSLTLRQLITEIFEASRINTAKNQTDTTKYIDYDKYDAMLLIHAGAGQESDVANNGSGDTPDDIWSVGFVDANLVLPGGKKIDNVLIAPETEVQDGNGENSPLGVTCHEFGHLLGLPDLYDIDNSSLGVGGWDLMGYGAWRNKGKTPCMLSSWTLIQLGYMAPTEVLNDAANLSVTALSDSPNALKIYAVSKERSPDEYFLVENRQKKGFDAYIEAGILIWHVDDTVGAISGNSINYNETHKRLDLEVASGLDANGKDRLDYNVTGSKAVLSTDLFYAGYKTDFNAYTNPSSISYNGTDASVGITVLSPPADVMNVNVTTKAISIAQKVEISRSYFYPNPVSGRNGKFYYFLNFTPSDVKIKIFDRNRKAVFERDLAGRFGANEFSWNLLTDDMSEVSNGTYFYRLTADSAEKTGKIVVLK